MQPTNRSTVLLSCIIVNFRTPDMVIACLPGLLHELQNISSRVIIVDNHSADDSVAQLQRWIDQYQAHDQVHLIASPRNDGFAAGNNIGIRAQSAEFYLLLNSDTLIKPGAIASLLGAAQQHPKAGLFSPRLEWPNQQGQESCFRFHSPASELIGSANTGLVTWLLARYDVPLPVQTAPCQPEWTSFACVMIRHAVFEQTGLLDDGYFMYYEDVEFCWRASQHGWGIYHQPQAHVVHLRGGSSPVKNNLQQKKRPPRYYYESRARYFYQTYGATGPLLANLAWTGGRCISFIRQWLGRPDLARPAKQWRDIWINWRTPLAPYTHPSKA